MNQSLVLIISLHVFVNKCNIISSNVHFVYPGLYLQLHIIKKIQYFQQILMNSPLPFIFLSGELIRSETTKMTTVTWYQRWVGLQNGHILTRHWKLAPAKELNEVLYSLFLWCCCYPTLVLELLPSVIIWPRFYSSYNMTKCYHNWSEADRQEKSRVSMSMHLYEQKIASYWWTVAGKSTIEE